MSKRTKRIVLSVLISLAVIAGVYTSVLGASLHAGALGGTPHVTGGLQPDYTHQRTGITSLNEYNSDLQGPDAQPHHCHDNNASTAPDD